jgi:hypothetical protein
VVDVAKKYTKEHIEYLRKISPGRYNSEITKMFNEKFNMNQTKSAIATIRQRNGIKSGVPRNRKKYTKEQLDYLKKLCEEGLFNDEITKKFNKHFGTNKSESAIKNQRAKYKMHTSARNYWPKGHEPWNKGKKGFMGPNKTSFKKGHKPHNWVPIGSERITKDGYVQIKIQEGKFQKNWRGKHILVWEAVNGPLPKGHAIIFGDGNNRNFDLDNLILVSRAQLLKLNQQGLIKNDADLTRTGVIIADLQMKISERSK